MTDRPPPDPALLELFRAELETHLATLSAGVLSLEQAPEDPKQLESLMRAAHSIKGAAKIVGFDAAVQVSHHLEDCFVAAQRGQISLGSDSVDVLLRGVDALGRLGTSTGAAAGDHGLAPAAWEPLIAEIAAVRSGRPPVPERPAALPAPIPPMAAVTPAAAASQATLHEFVSEAKEHLATVVQDLLALEQQPGRSDAERIDRLFRAMHSVKGGAGFVGCQVIEELAHALEHVLEELRQTGTAPDSGVVDALLAGTDRILALVDDAERSNEADVGDLVQRLRHCLARPQAAEPATAVPPSNSAAPVAASVPPGVAAPSGSDRAATVRIPVPLVDRLMTLAGELVLVRNQALRSIDAGQAAIRPVLQRLDALTSQLQGAVTQTRMQPVGNLFAKFPRTVRDLARQMGKAIGLEVNGTEVELDKSVLELLSDPLTHLIRNCCDHGLESPDERTRAGKPATGRIVLNARQQGGQICIEVRDDGRGIDAQRIKRKALESGLRTAAELARLSDKEALGLITLPGFSTAAAVTDLSGRGVGMDVVKTNLDQLGGTLEIDSTLGQGTSFALRVPLTLAIIPCLMVRAGDQRYAIPQKDLEELVCLHPQAQTRIEYTLEQEVVRLRDRLLPLVRLAGLLDRPRPLDMEAREAIVRKHRPSAESVDNTGSTARPAAATFFAVVRVGARRFGLVVDEILKNEEIVVKPMHSLLKPLTCFSGATILGDGRVALILNMEGIVQHAGVRSGTTVEQRVAAAAGREETTPALLFRYGPQEQFAVPLAMIRRLVMIDLQRIERVGSREFIVVDGASTPLLRLDQVLPVSAGVEANPLFLLLPKNIGRPLGLLATAIIDTEALPTGITRTTFPADGVVGSAIIRGRMTLLLDLCRLAELGDPARSPRPAGSAEPRKQKILAVDDAEFFRELVRGYLEAEGYEVVSAANGAEALQNLEAGHFDLVVSDIEMPVMDGWALARAIRERPGNAPLPLLALTTLSSDVDRARAKACGFEGYEVKLDRQRFLETVANLIRKGDIVSTA
ncbi:MAG: chemotaxis protein CheW [Pirellulaceae bacterium]|nr:chemotaxis protein CheW [Pirellulaceae bacterium]